MVSFHKGTQPSENEEEQLKTRMIGATAVLTMSMLVAGGSMVSAKEGDVRKSGSCSSGSTWKLKLSKDDSRLETEFEVDQNKNGDTWKVSLKHEGVRYFKGERVTKAPSGSFEVSKRVDDAAGQDTIRAWAKNLRTDEVCRGVAKI